MFETNRLSQFLIIASLVCALVFFVFAQIFRVWEARMEVVVSSSNQTIEQTQVAIQTFAALVESSSFALAIHQMDSDFEQVYFQVDKMEGEMMGVRIYHDDREVAKSIAILFDDKLTEFLHNETQYDGVHVQSLDLVQYRHGISYPFLLMLISLGIGLLCAYGVDSIVQYRNRYTFSLQKDSLYGKSSTWQIDPSRLTSRKTSSQKNESPSETFSSVQKKEDVHSIKESNHNQEVPQGEASILDKRFKKSAPNNLPIAGEVPEYLKDLFGQTSIGAKSEEKPTAAKEQISTKSDDIDGSTRVQFTQKEEILPSVNATSIAQYSEPRVEPTEEEMKERLNKLLRGEL